jgi:hypothetical protein
MPAILATLAITAVLEGQVTGTPSSRPPEARKATRLVRCLELPDRRSQAVVDLLRMGKGSVSALVLGLDRPREDIVFTCLHMLRPHGPAAKDALTRLEELEKGKNKKLAYAAARCRSRLEVEAAGVTLIADTHGNRVIEVDPKGKTVWSVKVSGAFGADRLPNGNTLFSSYTGRCVTEVDAKNKVVMVLKGLNPPNDAHASSTATRSWPRKGW